MKLTAKIYLLLFVALITGFLYFRSIELTNNTLQSNAEVLLYFNKLAGLQQGLDKQTLMSAYLIYHNYDHLEELIRELNVVIASLKSSEFYNDKQYYQVRELIEYYEKQLQLKYSSIYRFQTLNSIIKNSSTHIPSLGNRFIRRSTSEPPREYLAEVSSIVSNVFLTKNSLDPDFLADMDKSLDRLDQLARGNIETVAFNNIFRAHTRVFIDNFAQYAGYLSEVDNDESLRILGAASSEFSAISRDEVAKIENLTLFLFTIFGTSFLFIGWMLISGHRQNIALTVLQSKLHKEAYFDRLTGLKSRLAFRHDLENRQAPALILLDIDGFKRVNDFFGTEAGDELLKHVSDEILLCATERAETSDVYRMSADEYAVVLDNDSSQLAPQLATKIIDRLAKNTFKYKQFEIPVNLSVGISRQYPLLEKADLALKYIKDKRNKVLEYSSELKLETDVKNNLKTAFILRRAVEQQQVVPWFQPIMNNETSKVSHYECLVRIQEPDGNMLAPALFLPIAKQSRLYGKLTSIMMKRCFDKFRTTDSGFSVNFSAEDLLDTTITNRLFELLEAHPEAGERFTIELLETEAIEDYSVIQNVLSKARAYGCQIAIDDFGTGYSSLEHILKINPDAVKLDGSLIRNIDSDATMNTFIRAIVASLEKIGISRIVAEYVHSRAIQNIVREMGISHSQGYYIGKPEAQPMPIDHHRVE